ncbi:MAG: hypothetical protein ACI8T1_003371 [Verrucomicrobiales bacterium]
MSSRSEFEFHYHMDKPPITPDSHPAPPSKELRRLVDGFLLDELSRGEFSRLEELLESDPAARAYYLEIAGNEALLPYALREEGATSQSSPHDGRRRPRVRRLAVPVGIAAAAAIAAGLWLWQGGQPGGSAAASASSKSSPGLDSVGVLPVSITGEFGVTWAEGLVEQEVGDVLAGRTAAIEAGLLELQYQNGVTLLIEGPARYHVTGANSGWLDYGNLVADVPPGAEGFSVDYAGDRLVDHGTKFGVRLPRGGAPAEVAVFRGEVEVFPGDGERSAHLFSNHAVRRSDSEATGLESIPLDRTLYARELPSRELPWKVPQIPRGEKTSFEFDVSDLVRSAGEYRLVFKWMRGRQGIHVDNIELRLDGRLIAEDRHSGQTGPVRFTSDTEASHSGQAEVDELTDRWTSAAYATPDSRSGQAEVAHFTSGNIFTLRIPAESYGRGRWTVHATAWSHIPTDYVPSPGEMSDSEGILLVEEGLANDATAEDFLGRWDYWHNGHLYARELFADGTAILSYDGEVHRRPTWGVENGVLEIRFPDVDLTEGHLLRDRETLIFVDRPYRNARKVSE